MASFAFGIILILFVVFLAIKATSTPSLVIWFGLASALLVPLGLASMGYTFTAGNKKIFEKLSKVPEIEKLVKEAESQEERIRILKEDRSRLLEVVELEARKQALVSRRESLEKDGIRIVQGLDNVIERLKEVDSDLAAVPLSDEVKTLRERIRAKRRGDIVFRIFGKEFIIDKDVLSNLPFGGVLLSYAKGFETIYELIEKLLILILKKIEKKNPKKED